MKPASFTAVIGAHADGDSRGGRRAGWVVNFVPGSGGQVGDYLMRHHGVNMIVFTGSRDVGLSMIRSAAEFPKEQRFIKKVVAELGGKNALIIDSDADLDAAVEGTIASAFGYAGQKCSLARRAIVLERVYNSFVDKLAEAAKSVVVGPPEDPATFVGPVIDEQRPPVHPEVHPDRSQGRTRPGRARRLQAGQAGLLRRTDGHRRRRSARHHRSGGDLRPGPGRHQGQGLRRRPGHRQRHVVRADRRDVLAQSAAHRTPQT